MATVVLTHEAAEELEKLDNPIHGRVLKLLLRLQKWPDVSGAKPLRGDLAGRYRMRTGDYRVQFRVQPGDTTLEPPTPDVVRVEKIGHRDGFYDE